MNLPKFPHPQSTKAAFLPVIIFNVAYLALAAFLARGHDNHEFLFYILVMLVLFAAVGLLHMRVGLSRGVLWCLSLWGLAHMAGGLITVPQAWPVENESSVLYSWWLIPNKLKYDNVIHTYGFAITTWVCWQCLSTAIKRSGGTPKASFGLMVLCATAGMGFGALNEVVEFIATLTIPETNVGGYINTGWDLVANLLGATAATLLIYCHNKCLNKNKEQANAE